EEFPSGDVLGVTDPNVEIRVDPGSGENAVVRGNITCGGNGFAGGERAEIGIILNAAKKFAAVSRVVFPGVFAIEEKADGKGLRRLNAVSEGAEPAVKVRSGVAGA